MRKHFSYKYKNFFILFLIIYVSNVYAQEVSFLQIRNKITDTKSRFRKYLSYSEFLNESIERLNSDFINEMKEIEKLSEQENVLKAKYKTMTLDQNFISHLQILSDKYKEFYIEVDSKLNEIMNLRVEFNNKSDADFYARLVRSIEEDNEKILILYNKFKEQEKFIKESALGLKRIFESLTVEKGALVYKESKEGDELNKARNLNEDSQKGSASENIIMFNKNNNKSESPRPEKLNKKNNKLNKKNNKLNKKNNKLNKKNNKLNTKNNKLNTKNNKNKQNNELKIPVYFDELPELNSENPVYKRPLCIMIENHRAARPQSGLEYGDIVLEMLAEGGITRFMAVVPQNKKGVFGPVRSCRHYFTDFVSQFDGVYVHCGSSSQGLEAIKARKITSLNEIKYSNPFYRVKFRKAPHNLYCDSDKIVLGIQKYKFRPNTQVTPPDQQFNRFDSPVSNGKNQLVRIRYHKNYSVEYLYNSGDNKYYRTINSKPHIIYNKNQQLSCDNIAVIRADTKTIDKYGRLDINFKGSGIVYIYCGGHKFKGLWTKKSPRDILNFADENKNPLKFNPGNIWIQVVKKNTPVSPE